MKKIGINLISQDLQYKNLSRKSFTFNYFKILKITLNQTIKLFIPAGIFLLLLLSFCISQAQVNVLMHHNNIGRTGVNSQETLLNVKNVNSKTFGKTGSYPVDDQVYAQPLVFTNVPLKKIGSKNLLLICTVNNSVYAFDADSPGSPPLWHVNFNTPTAVPPRNTDMTGACDGHYTDFTGNIGIVSTPAIDSSTFTLYCLARTKENGKTFVQKLHALSILDGSEKPNSPVEIKASYPGHGYASANGIIDFDPWRHNQRAALTIFDGLVYITWASHCDWAPYHGWIMGYDITTLNQEVVYNDTPEGYAGGIWMAGAGFTSDGKSLFVVTGNGSAGSATDPNDPINRGESAMKLNRDGNKLRVDSWFTPFNYEGLEDLDQDLGSSGPVILSGTNLMAFGGKEGKIYVVNKDSMGGFNPNNDTQIVQSFFVHNNHHIHGTPVFWRGDQGQYLYVWSENEYLKMYKFNPEALQFDSVPYRESLFPVPDGMPGAMLSLTSNGNEPNTGILWASHPFTGDANHATRPGVLRAFDANDVSKELWNSEMTASDTFGNFAKFVCPTIANGKVYLATFSNQIVVYGAKGTPPVDSVPVVSVRHGINFKYYEGDFDTLPDFQNLFPVKQGTVYHLGIENRDQENHFAYVFSSQINIPHDGLYNFSLGSDDGSNLFVSDSLLIDNDGLHAADEKSASIFLTKGFHPLTLQYFQKGGASILSLSMEGPGFTKQIIPDSLLYLPAVQDTSISILHGVKYSYYEGSFDSTSAFANFSPKQTGYLRTVSISPRKQDDYFAFKYEGFIYLPVGGQYTFYLDSDDGSTLRFNNEFIINNDGLHGLQERQASLELMPGYYPYVLNYFEKNGENVLSFLLDGPGISKQPVPANLLYRTAPSGGRDTSASSTGTIKYSYYEGSWTALPDFSSIVPMKTGFVNNFTLKPALRASDFGMEFQGTFLINVPGIYTFYTSSDDGSKLYIDFKEVVNNDGCHGISEQSGQLYLTAGKHPFLLDYFQQTNLSNLFVSYEGPGIPKQAIPSSILSNFSYPSFRLADETSSSASLSVYPNPTDGMVHLAFQSDVAGTLTIRIVNQLSVSVLETTVDVVRGTNELNLDLRNFGGGVYQLNAKNESNDFSAKIVLVK